MTNLKHLKPRLMRDPVFLEEYAGIEEEFALIAALVDAGKSANSTQAEIARRTGATRAGVARQERGMESPSFATLPRYAAATGTRLLASLIPAD